MKYFAKLDLNSKVLGVHVVNENNAANEEKGIEFLTKTHNYSSWKETSGDIRKNFAGVGDTYDKDRDAFIPIKHHSSWVFDEDTCRWKAPVAYPNDGTPYSWNEETISWEALIPPV